MSQGICCRSVFNMFFLGGFKSVGGVVCWGLNWFVSTKEDVWIVYYSLMEDIFLGLRDSCF